MLRWQSISVVANCGDLLEVEFPEWTGGVGARSGKTESPVART